jgi:putative transposase
VGRSRPAPSLARKFCAAFDEVFRSEGIRVTETPIRAPQANAYAEGFVRTVRAGCLDWVVSSSTCSAPTPPTTNSARPHRALALIPPEAGNTAVRPANAKIERHDLLGGLIQEYRAAA